jgi:hypothetical protein
VSCSIGLFFFQVIRAVAVIDGKSIFMADNDYQSLRQIFRTRSVPSGGGTREDCIPVWRPYNEKFCEVEMSDKLEQLNARYEMQPPLLKKQLEVYDGKPLSILALCEARKS